MNEHDDTPSTSQQRVRAALAAHGLVDVEVRSFPQRTATAAEAANAIGTTVDRIVKSLVFLADGQPIIVLVAGSDRVDVDKVAALVGRPVKRASADDVRALTGFAIGGVPPVGHTSPLTTLVDRGLLAGHDVWAAAGTPNSVFAVAPGRLVEMTGGRVDDVAQTA